MPTTVTDEQIAFMRAITSARWKAYGLRVGHHIGDLAWALRDRSQPTRLVLLDDRA